MPARASTRDCTSGRSAACRSGRQIEPRERRRDELRCGRFEIEQQAERVCEVDIGEVPEHGAVDAPVEQSGQDGLAQQHLPRFRLEIEDGAGELAEHDPRDARIERGEERRDVAELPAEGVAADLPFGDVVFGQAQEHAGERRRVVREERQVDERDLLEARRRIDAHPALVGRVEVNDRAAGREELVALCFLLRDHARDGRRWRADVDDLGPVGRRAGRCG